MPRAATIGRIELSPSIASRKPPISPTTFSAGHAHVVEEQLAGVDALHPHLAVDRARPTTPGQPRSTMNAVTLSCARDSAGPVLANTQYQSAWRTPDIQHFVPESIQSSPSRRGPGADPHHVAAGLGLREPERGAGLAGRDRARRSARCCSSAPGDQHRARSGSRVSSSMSAAAFEYLATSSIASVSPRMPAPEPPSSSGMQRPVRPASTKSSKRSWGYSLGLVDLPRPRRDPLLGELADGRLELRELGREVELHQHRGYTGGARLLGGRRRPAELRGAAALADEPAALPSGEPAPDAVLLARGDRVLEAGLADGTELADRLGLVRLVVLRRPDGRPGGPRRGTAPGRATCLLDVTWSSAPLVGAGASNRFNSRLSPVFLSDLQRPSLNAHRSLHADGPRPPRSSSARTPWRSDPPG